MVKQKDTKDTKPEKKGLSNNHEYVPTAHFKQRLSERLNINGNGWQNYIKQLYSTLEYDDYLSKQQPHNQEVYVSKKKNVQIVVDPIEKKLITIYIPGDYIHNNLQEIDKTREFDINTMTNEYTLDQFAKLLKDRELNLQNENKYLYAQKVLYNHHELIEEFISLYGELKEAESSVENQNKMIRLIKLANQFKNIVEQTSLPDELKK